MNVDYVSVLLGNDVPENERYYIIRDTASIELLRQLFKAAYTVIAKDGCFLGFFLG